MSTEVYIYKWKHQTFSDWPASSVNVGGEGRGLNFEMRTERGGK
jgi:hypothetical protein